MSVLGCLMFHRESFKNVAQRPSLKRAFALILSITTVAAIANFNYNFRLVNIQPSSLTGEPGETVTVETDLLLIGTETAQFVQIEVIDNHSFSLVSESYENVDRVDQDSPVPFDIQFMTAPDATSGNHMLQIRVSYWDEYDQEREAIRKLPIIVEGSEVKSEAAGLDPTFLDIIWSVVRILFGVNP